MRAHIHSTVLALTFGLTAGCSGAGEDEPASAAAPVAPEPTAAAPTPAPPPVTGSAPAVAKIGGSVVVAGTYSVEVLPQASGEIEALVVDAAGAPVTSGATLSVAVKGSDDAVHPVSLAYDAERGSYAGKLEGELSIVPGPVEVTVTAGGAPVTGRFETLAVAPVPSHGGGILVAGSAAAEVAVEPEGVVHAYFVDAAGAPVTGEIDGEASVLVAVEGAEPHRCRVRWDAGLGHHVGRVDAGVRVVPGPVELVVDVRGAAHRGRLERMAFLRPAAHGGQVAVAGEYTVEVVPKPDGFVDAYVVDVEGAPVTEHASFTAHVGADLRPVTMVWNAEAGCYRGEVGANVDVSVRPLEVVLVGRGRRHFGGVTVVRPAARRGAAVEVVAEAPPPPRVEVRANVPAPSVSVRASAGAGTQAAAGASVRGPGAQVRGGVSVPPPPSVTVRAGVSAGGGASAGGSASGERRRSSASGSASGGIRVGAGAGVRLGN